MKILLLGSGGREHALAWKIAQSQKIEKLFIAPGNAGTTSVGENVPLKADDFEGIKAFVVANAVDMVVVGPEDPLVKGVYDFFKQDAQLKDIRASCSVMASPQLLTAPSMAPISKRASLSSKLSSPHTC